jgi:HSP20 family protein
MAVTTVARHEVDEMALMKRTPSEMEWPDWIGRRLSEFPSFRDLLEAGDAAMHVEEFEEEGRHVVRAEMPGLDPEQDIEITVSGGTLRIKAERRQETKTEDKKGYRTEFRYGSFLRTVALPAGASEADVTATYADGILEVRIPISPEEAAARKIPVGRG